MSAGRQKPLTVPVEATRFSGRLYGPVRVLHGPVKAAASKWQYDHLRHCYAVPLRDLDRVLAAVERAGHRVEMTLARWS